MRTTVFWGVLIALSLSSCNFMLKKDSFWEGEPADYTTEENNFNEADESESCDFQSGYRWSGLKDNCVRIFAEGFRLNPIELSEGAPEENELEDNDVSCFVLFNTKKDSVEFFLPNTKKGIVMKESAVKGLFNTEGWELDVRKDMRLSYKGQLKYTAAKTIELKVIGSHEQYDETIE